MVFECAQCERNLPDFMQNSSTICNECATGKVDKTGTEQNEKSDILTEESKSFSELGIKHDSIVDSSNTSTSSANHDATPEVVDPSSFVDTESNDTQSETNFNTNNSGTDSSSSQSTETTVKNGLIPSNHIDAQVYHPTEPEECSKDLQPCDVFALGYYDNKADNRTVRDKYAQRIIDYCKEYKNKEKNKEFFLDQLRGFFNQRIDLKDFDPDIITVYPKHDDGFSDALSELARQIATEYPIEYNEILSRSKECSKQKGVTEDERWENQLGTIGIKQQLDDDTVLLLDDIVTTGASVTIGKNKLINNGADSVIAICLGIVKSSRGQYRREIKKDHHSVRETSQHLN